MADFLHIKCKINGKPPHIAKISYSVRKSGSGNRMMVLDFTPEVHK